MAATNGICRTFRRTLLPNLENTHLFLNAVASRTSRPNTRSFLRASCLARLSCLVCSQLATLDCGQDRAVGLGVVGTIGESAGAGEVFEVCEAGDFPCIAQHGELKKVSMRSGVETS